MYEEFFAVNRAKIAATGGLSFTFGGSFRSIAHAHGKQCKITLQHNLLAAKKTPLEAGSSGEKRNERFKLER